MLLMLPSMNFCETHMDKAQKASKQKKKRHFADDLERSRWNYVHIRGPRNPTDLRFVVRSVSNYLFW